MRAALIMSRRLETAARIYGIEDFRGRQRPALIAAAGHKDPAISQTVAL